MLTISEQIAEWVKAVNYDDIPVEQVEIAKRNILDFIGVTLAGSREPVAEIVRKYLNDIKAAKQSTVIGLGTKTSRAEAAFANGLLGHCLDYDDLVIPTMGAGGPHITAVVLPAALAVAEKEGKGGKDVIEAYILGCEIAYRVGRGVDPAHYNAGWHSTETEGVFGATIAAAKLLGLSAGEITFALGIAGSEASGLRENFGTMTKPFHAGQACAKGIRAALLAKLGFDSAKTIFEGKYGFCHVLSEHAQIDEIVSNLGQFYCLPQTRLKLYPCCAASHTAIYATLELSRLNDIKVKDIEAIEVTCDPLVPTILVYDQPKTAAEGKFSMQFPLALAITEKEVILQQFSDARVTDTETIALMKKVRVTASPELRAIRINTRPALVEIRFKDGSKLVNRCDAPPGTTENPLSEQDVARKFSSCASLVLPEDRIKKSTDLIMNLEKADDIRKLLRILTPASNG